MCKNYNYIIFNNEIINLSYNIFYIFFFSTPLDISRKDIWTNWISLVEFVLRSLSILFFFPYHFSLRLWTNYANDELLSLLLLFVCFFMCLFIYYYYYFVKRTFRKYRPSVVYINIVLYYVFFRRLDCVRTIYLVK